MPRKKASTAPAGGSVSCPACKSEITADGGALLKRSAYLDDLIETDAEAGKFAKAIDALEAKLAAKTAEVAELKGKLAAAQSKPEEKNEPVERKEKKRDDDDGWW